MEQQTNKFATSQKKYIPRGKAKSKAAVDYNAARDMTNNGLLGRPAGIKLIEEHPFYKAKFDEMREAQDNMEKEIRKFALKGSENSEAAEFLKEITEKTVIAGRRRIANLWKKRYGRSKYIPH